MIPGRPASAGRFPPFMERNDALRTTFRTGHVAISPGIVALGRAFEAAALEAVRTYDAFTPENDPHGEHEFGIVDVEGFNVVWEIEFPNPIGTPLYDPRFDMPILSILLAEEYWPD